jgi:hypothetical protein
MAIARRRRERGPGRPQRTARRRGNRLQLLFVDRPEAVFRGRIGDDGALDRCAR